MNAPVTSYVVDLLYDELPLFTRDEVLHKLRDRCGAASAMDPGPDGGRRVGQIETELVDQLPRITRVGKREEEDAVAFD